MNAVLTGLGVALFCGAAAWILWRSARRVGDPTYSFEGMGGLIIPSLLLLVGVGVLFVIGGLISLL